MPCDTARSATGGRHPGEPGNDEAGVTGGEDEDRDGKNEDEGEPQHDVILAADCAGPLSTLLANARTHARTHASTHADPRSPPRTRALI